MSLSGSLQLSHALGLCRDRDYNKRQKSFVSRGKLHLLNAALSSRVSFQQQGTFTPLTDYVHRPVCSVPRRSIAFRCHSFTTAGKTFELPAVKAASLALLRSYNLLQRSPVVIKLVPAVALLVFSLWGLVPLVCRGRNLLLNETDNGWKKSSTYHVITSYIQPLLLWTGALLVCRTLDPIVLPTEASQIVKDRLLNFVRSLSTVLAFAYCFSSVIQQTHKFFTETSDPSNARNMGFQFAGKAIYSAVWVAAVSLFMELLGFSTQKWLTAGGFGTVLITLAGREIFTNFLSSLMIHATRPFVINEWIQTKIEGYDVSGVVERVGWWSPTIIRGEDREAVHIPNHKFTVNVVRNLTQKTHWRIKTHLAISHLDVNKINNIVADMRKVLAKNPQVEQQRLHRRVFLDNVNPENQALLILVSCFVKTSHHEEYLRAKEAILLDLLRVISHHRARLATPIRTIRNMYSDSELDNIPFGDSLYDHGGVASRRPLLLIEPSYRINGEDKSKSQTRSSKPSSEQEPKKTYSPKFKENSKIGETPNSDPTLSNEAGAKKSKSTPKPLEMEDLVTDETEGADSSQISVSRSKPQIRSSKPTFEQEPKTSSPKSKENSNIGETPNSDPKLRDEAGVKRSKSVTKQPKAEDLKTDEPERAKGSKTSASRLALEENIVLGVALEGSKRTLPIEEDGDSSSTAAPKDAKELAGTCRNGNGTITGNKDKKDGHVQATPNKSSGEQ